MRCNRYGNDVDDGRVFCPKCEGIKIAGKRYTLEYLAGRCRTGGNTYLQKTIMKKTLVLCLLLLAFPALLLGCGAQKNEVTIDYAQAMEANTVDHLLENYDNVSYSQLDYTGGNTIRAYFYRDEAGQYCGVWDYYDSSDYETDCFEVFYDHDCAPVYNLSAEKKTNVSDYAFMVEDGKFTSQTIDTNGDYVCTTQSNISQDYADALSDVWTVTTEDKMLTTTVFAANDLRALSVDFSILHPDGSEQKIVSSVLLYNQEIVIPTDVQTYLDEKKNTLTVRMEDGTEKIAELPSGETFSWSCDDGYSLYLDENGQTPLPETPEAVTADMTLYCLPTT